MVNDRFDLALLCRRRRRASRARTTCPPPRSPGRRRRARRLLDRALAPTISTHGRTGAPPSEGVDYVAFGPVFGTASKDTGYDARGLQRHSQEVSAHALRPCPSSRSAASTARTRGRRVARERAAAWRRGDLGGRRCAGPRSPPQRPRRCTSNGARRRASRTTARRARLSAFRLARSSPAVGFLAILLAIAWACSKDRRRFRGARRMGPRPAARARRVLLLTHDPAGASFFVGVNAASSRASWATTTPGSRFLFGALDGYRLQLLVAHGAARRSSSWAACLRVLYHLGIVQRIVDAARRAPLAHPRDLSRVPRASPPSHQRLRRHGRVGARREALPRGHDPLRAVQRDERSAWPPSRAPYSIAYVGHAGRWRLRGPPGDGQPALCASGHWLTAKLHGPGERNRRASQRSAAAHAPVDARRASTRSMRRRDGSAQRECSLAIVRSARLLLAFVALDRAGERRCSRSRSAAWFGIEGLRCVSSCLLGWAMAPIALVDGRPRGATRVDRGQPDRS